MLYTTYFAKLRRLPENIVPVAICGKVPPWFTGLQYQKPAPMRAFFSEWKRNHDNDYYIRRFNEQVLEKLAPQQVYAELKKLAGAEDIALVCYEAPNNFCHRHLVREWLKDADIPITEYGI